MKRFHVSKNLFDYSTTEIGSISTTNGSDIEYDNARRSDFIPVQSGVTYTFSGLGSDIRIFEYKPDKTYRNTNYLYTIPVTISRTGYIRIAGALTAIIPEIMLNTGSEALPYEPYGDTWQTRNPPHYGTSTDTITTLPVDLYADGNNATVGLVGNMYQASGVSPTTPIQPSECGERTENLWANSGFSTNPIGSGHVHTSTNSYGTALSSTTGTETTITQSQYPTGDVSYTNGFFFIDVDFSKYNVGDIITLSFDYICTEIHSTTNYTALYAGNSSNAISPKLSSGSWNINGRLSATITIINNMNPYVEVRLCGNSITVKNVMLNLGTTALPYEPYGYKIPISSANTTTPVYLGEVQSERNVYKYAFTGQENDWRITGTGRMACVLPTTSLKSQTVPCMCSHYIGVGTSSIGSINNGECSTNTSNNEFIAYDTNYTTLADFKTYLQQQYSAGTPVTVWYVLATPTTGIVNEPLRKIGDYADSVSGITIPTIAGANSFDVLTTLKPSEVTVNYKGWHPVSSVHERDNGAWT